MRLIQHVYLANLERGTVPVSRWKECDANEFVNDPRIYAVKVTVAGKSHCTTYMNYKDPTQETLDIEVKNIEESEYVMIEIVGSGKMNALLSSQIDLADFLEGFSEREMTLTDKTGSIFVSFSGSWYDHTTGSLSDCEANQEMCLDVFDIGSAPDNRAELAFSLFEGDKLLLSVASGKLETVVTLESKRSKDKWECRFGDAEIKAAGPKGVEIPREVVTRLLKEALEKTHKIQEERGNGDEVKATSHSVSLKKSVKSGECLDLELLLDFGTGWRPTYALELKKLTIKTEDKLRAQIVDLRNELAEVRKEMQVLKERSRPAPCTRLMHVTTNVAHQCTAEWIHILCVVVRSHYLGQR